jgi:hypothetical protein
LRRFHLIGGVIEQNYLKLFAGALNPRSGCSAPEKI